MLKSLFILAALAVCSLCNGQETPGRTICIPKDRKPVVEVPVSAPDARFIGPTLPCFTAQLSDNDYKWWVMEQNEIAYAQAAQNRLSVGQRGPAGVVTERSMLGQSSGILRGWNNFSTREVQTIAPGAAEFGGGPVWIHNPFVRQ